MNRRRGNGVHRKLSRIRRGLFRRIEGKNRGRHIWRKDVKRRNTERTRKSMALAVGLSDVYRPRQPRFRDWQVVI